MQEHAPSLGKTSLRWCSFITFVQPLTTEEKLRVLFSFAITCSLIHKYHRTTNPEEGVPW